MICKLKEKQKDNKSYNSELGSSRDTKEVPLVSSQNTLPTLKRSLATIVTQYKSPFTIAGVQYIKFNIISETRGTPLPNYKRHAYKKSMKPLCPFSNINSNTREL